MTHNKSIKGEGIDSKLVLPRTTDEKGVRWHDKVYGNMQGQYAKGIGEIVK